MKKHLYVALFILVTALMFSLNVYADGFFGGSGGGSAGGGAPSGDAGGDLDGTYPDPTVVDDSHNHTGTSVGSLDAGTDLTTGTVPTARLGSGTADDTTFLRGDQTWQELTPSGGASNAIFLLGADNGEALADTDDQPDFFCNESGVTLTITEVVCRSDAGTPAVNLQKDDGSPTDMLASDLTCATGAGTSQTSFVSGENVIPDGTCVDFVMDTAGGVAKRLTFNMTTEGGQGGVGLSPGDDIGEATATTPDPADDSDRVATTEWVNDNAGGGGGAVGIFSCAYSAATINRYAGLSGEWSSCMGLETNAQNSATQIWPVASTFTTLCCRVEPALTSSDAITTTIRKNEADTALAVTLNAATRQACDTGSVAFAQFDRGTARIIGSSGSPGTTRVACAYIYE